MKKSQSKERQKKTSQNIPEGIGTLIEAKALSVNECWLGRKFKTLRYIAYEKEILALLPRREKITGDFALYILFGLEHLYKPDLDNFAKPLIDIMQKKGYFEDDRYLMQLTLAKIYSTTNFIQFVFKKL